MGIINDLGPNKEMKYKKGESSVLAYSSCEMQSWRSKMVNLIKLISGRCEYGKSVKRYCDFRRI